MSSPLQALPPAGSLSVKLRRTARTLTDAVGVGIVVEPEAMANAGSMIARAGAAQQEV